MHRKRTLAEYIARLESKWEARGEHDYPTKRIGRGNPYYKCSHCGRSDPEISYTGHHKGCKWWQVYCMIQGLKKLAPEAPAVGKQPKEE
jgi:hypothetical protein